MSPPTESSTALVLTQDEWDALEHVCSGYLKETNWVDDGEEFEYVRVNRALCERIVKANS